MFIYLFIFGFSIVATACAQHFIKQNKKTPFYFFSSIAILMPALLAGFRDSGVGTDTEIYVDRIWWNIQYIHGWDDFVYAYRHRSFDDIELIYLLLNWIGSWFGRDVQIIYFLSNFIVVLFVYMTLYDYRKKIPMWFVMSLFLFLYYCLSLNLVRQSIALAIGLYAFKYAIQKEWAKLAAWAAIILFSHNTGIFYLVFIGFYWIYTHLNTPAKRKLFFGVSLVCVILLFWYLPKMIPILVSAGLLPEKYLFYMSNENTGRSGRSALALNLVLFSILWYIKSCHNKWNNRQQELVNFAFAAKLISLLLLSLTFVSLWCFRISYYFSFVTDLIFLPLAIQSVKLRNRTAYKLLISFTFFFAVFMWFWLLVYKNENDVIPYKSVLLGI